MSAEAEHIRRAIRIYTVRRNTREVCIFLATIYALCGIAAWAVFS